LTEKRDGGAKGRHCANGKPQRQWIEREEPSSPTVSTETTIITSVIDAMEGRDVATCDIPKAFIQTEKDDIDKDGDRTIMKIRGILVDILCELEPSYLDFVVWEKREKTLYMHVLKAYGLLESAILFYRRLVSDLIGYGFELNPYDPCVANKMVNGQQLTVSWHVDDMKMSHKQS
jgi:hypothetical protein